MQQKFLARILSLSLFMGMSAKAPPRLGTVESQREYGSVELASVRTQQQPGHKEASVNVHVKFLNVAYRGEQMILEPPKRLAPRIAYCQIVELLDLPSMVKAVKEPAVAAAAAASSEPVNNADYDAAIASIFEQIKANNPKVFAIYPVADQFITEKYKNKYSSWYFVFSQELLNLASSEPTAEGTFLRLGGIAGPNKNAFAKYDVKLLDGSVVSINARDRHGAVHGVFCHGGSANGQIFDELESSHIVYQGGNHMPADRLSSITTLADITYERSDVIKDHALLGLVRQYQHYPQFFNKLASFGSTFAGYSVGFDIHQKAKKQELHDGAPANLARELVRRTIDQLFSYIFAHDAVPNITGRTIETTHPLEMTPRNMLAITGVARNASCCDEYYGALVVRLDATSDSRNAFWGQLTCNAHDGSCDKKSLIIQMTDIGAFLQQELIAAQTKKISKDPLKDINFIDWSNFNEMQEASAYLFFNMLLGSNVKQYAKIVIVSTDGKFFGLQKVKISKNRDNFFECHVVTLPGMQLEQNVCTPDIKTGQFMLNKAGGDTIFIEVLTAKTQMATSAILLVRGLNDNKAQEIVAHYYNGERTLAEKI